MILYHGSTVSVDAPHILESVSLLDFGAGFYTTQSYEQAERWARVKMRRAKAERGFVSVYEFDEQQALQAQMICRFDRADMVWLQFVVGNRRGTAVSDASEIHIGPVADDTVYASIQLFETGVLNAEETIKRLKTETLHDQIVFHTENALRLCRFVEAKEIR